MAYTIICSQCEKEIGESNEESATAVCHDCYYQNSQQDNEVTMVECPWCETEQQSQVNLTVPKSKHRCKNCGIAFATFRFYAGGVNE